MQAKELAQLIAAKKAPTIVDVRSGGEFAHGHIPGAIHAPSWKIALNISGLPDDKSLPLVITCEHGPRAVMAQGILAAYGYRNSTLLEGHMSGWRKAKLPVEV